MHSISPHKYPLPLSSSCTIIITIMKHYTTTHNYNFMMMKSKFPTSNFVQEPFGGFIWPPRFYTCTFCRREFRSAQALGGHMNVHRRDRARLKQSSPPQNQEIPTDLATGRRDNEGFIETKLSMGIELCDSENVICKRHKKSGNVSSPLPFLLQTSSMEGIDLELRLGDPPAVKLETN